MRVLVTQATDIPGQWVAHCLDIDLVTQADSPQHALSMAREAVLLIIDDDLRKGLDPLERAGAPQEQWEAFARVITKGHLYFTVDAARVTALAAWIRIQVIPRTDEEVEAPCVETIPAD
jgi:predicted RNase H-like HicB family nuclease